MSFPMIFILLFFGMLFCPKLVLNGAREGLLLWYQTVLPTLFPFMFLCSVLVQSGAFVLLSRWFSEPVSRIFRCSSHGAFAVLSGFLCGYPMGARVIADLYRNDYITFDEGSYLLSFCNNTSPAFLISFLVLQNLRHPSLILPSLFLAFASPILCSFFFRINFRKNACDKHRFFSSKYAVPQSDGSGSLSVISVIDQAVNDALTGITKVGGYLVMFCVFSAFLTGLPLLPAHFSCIVASTLEISNGIRFICDSPFPFPVKYTLCMALSSFGGWCAIAQTASMLKTTGFSIRSYIVKKLVTMLVTSLLTYLYLLFF